MKAQIDKLRSIQKKRLIYHLNPELFFNKIFENLIWIICLTIAVLPLTNAHQALTPTSICVATTVWIFIITGLYFINHLTVVTGLNEPENRHKIIEILKKRYPDFKINDSGKNIITFKKATALMGWGMQITVIFDEHRVLINSTTIGRYYIKSPFHSIFNVMAMQKIRKCFQEG